MLWEKIKIIVLINIYIIKKLSNLINGSVRQHFDSPNIGKASKTYFLWTFPQSGEVGRPTVSKRRQPGNKSSTRKQAKNTDIFPQKSFVSRQRIKNMIY